MLPAACTQPTYTHVHRYTHRAGPGEDSWLVSSSVDVHVEAVVLQLWKVLATHCTGAALVLAVRAPHVAVVCRVRGEGFAAVLALEGLLSRVLADVRAQDAGGCERLEGHRRRGGRRAGRGVSGFPLHGCGSSERFLIADASKYLLHAEG